MIAIDGVLVSIKLSVIFNDHILKFDLMTPIWHSQLGIPEVLLEYVSL